MSVDLSALTAYVDQIKSKLIKKSLLTSRMLETGVTIQTGIKSAEAINILSGILIAVASSCGISPTGSVALTQRNIPVCPITVFEDICAPEFDAYWTQIMNPAGSYYDKNPIEQVYADQKVNANQKLVGDLFVKGSKAGHQFNGTSSTTTGNITVCDGILEYAEYIAGSASVIVSGTASGFTTTNAQTIINQMITDALASAPDLLVNTDGNLNIYMSYNYFNILRQSMVNSNNFHYSGFPTGAEVRDWTFPNWEGTGFNIIADAGFNGTTRILLTHGANLIFGTDLENDTENFEVFYDQRFDRVYFRAKWKQGAQIAFPELVVLYKATAL